MFELKQEVSKLKEIADIARNQTDMIVITNKLQEKEMSALRQQALELQSGSDEKALIGNLSVNLFLLGPFLMRLKSSIPIFEDRGLVSMTTEIIIVLSQCFMRDQSKMYWEHGLQAPLATCL